MSHAPRSRFKAPSLMAFLLPAALLAWLLAAPGAAHALTKNQAQEQTGEQSDEQIGDLHVDAIQILEYGVYTSDIEYFIRDAGVVDHNKIIATNFVLIQATDDIQARLGTGFGIKYLIVGQPTGAEVPLDVVIDHPPLTNPQSDQTYTQSRVPFTRNVGLPQFTVWTFDEGWSLAPGTWTIRLLYQGRELAAKDFTVTLAP